MERWLRVLDITNIGKHMFTKLVPEQSLTEKHLTR